MRIKRTIITALTASLLAFILAGCENSRHNDTVTTSQAIAAEPAASTQELTPAAAPEPAFTPEPASGPTEDPETGASYSLKEKALKYVEALDCPIMSEEENKVNFRIESIEKKGDNYKIRWGGNFSGNEMFVFTKIHYFDPEDFTNHYQPFTIADGKIDLNFEEGDLVSPLLEYRIRFEPECQIVYLYFEGLLESMGAPPEIQTEPLFFTIVLGDEPELLEDSPRLANGIFEGYYD